MKKKKKIRKIRSVVVSLFVLVILMVSIYGGLILLRAWPGGLERQIALLLESQFGAKVEIEELQGELLKNIVLNNVILYREFREDQILLRASEVEIKVDLVSGVLKERVLIRSLKKLTFRDFDLYIDEDLSKSEIFRKLFGGKGDGETLRSLEVELVDGRVYSDFSDSSYPGLEILDLNLTVELLAPSVSIKGTGFLREQKKNPKEKAQENSFLYGTETPFHVQIDNFNGDFEGMLDLKELHYMGGVFKSLSLDMAFNRGTEGSLGMQASQRSLLIEMKPSDYAPFLATLPEEQRRHYEKGMAYQSLPQLYLEYFFDSGLFHVSLSAKESNQSVSDMVLYYLSHSPLKEYQNFLESSWNGEFLGSFDLWLSREGIEFLLRVDQTEGVVKKGDRLSFELEKRIGQAFIFRNLDYSGFGSVQSEGFFDPETKEQDFQIRVQRIPLRWIPLDTFAKIADSSGRLKPWFERIYWEEDFFSGQIHFFAKDGTYHVHLMNPRVSIYPLWNAKGSFSLQENALHFGLQGSEPFEYELEGVLPWESGSLLQVNLQWAGLQYSMIQKLLFLDKKNPVYSGNFGNFGNFGIEGKISASVDLENWQNSKASVLLKLFSQEAISAMLGKEEEEKEEEKEEVVQEEKRQELQELLVEEKPEAKTDSEPFFWASFGYEKNRFFLYDAMFKDYGAKLTGELAWDSKHFEKFRSEWVLLYSKDRYDLDLELDRIGQFYRTKLRVDKNELPWASLDADWTLKDSRLDFQRAVLSDGVALYDLVGFLDWKKQTIQSDLLLLGREDSSSPLLHLRGNLWFSGSEGQMEIFPDFSLRIRDLSIWVVGSLSGEGQRWFPNLQFSWGLQEEDQKTLGLKGWIVQESNQFESQISFSFQEKNYLGHMTLVSLEGAWDYSILIDGLSKESMGIKGRIHGVHGGLENQLFLFRKEMDKENILLESKASLSFQEDRLYTHWIFDIDGNRLDLDGYLQRAESDFLSRFQIQFFQGKKRKLSWWWDAVIRKNEKNWELKGKLDSGIRVHGLYEEYSKLSLDFWLDDLRFSLGKGRYLRFDSFFEGEQTDQMPETEPQKSYLSLRASPSSFQVHGKLWVQERSSMPDFGLSLGIFYTLQNPENIEFSEWNVYQKKRKGWSTVVKSKGSLSLSRAVNQENRLVFRLNDPQKMKFLFLYNLSNQSVGGNLELFTIDLKDFTHSFRGNVSGILSFEGSLNNPKIESKGIRVDRFFYQSQFWNMEFSFIKEERSLIVPYAFLNGPEKKLRMWNLQYIFSNPKEGFEHFIASFLEGGILSLEQAVFSDSQSAESNPKRTWEIQEFKFWLSKDLISVIQNVSNNITEPSQWLFLYKLVNQIKEESETRLNLKSFSWTGLDQSLEIKNLYILLSSNWRFDMESLKVKSTGLGVSHSAQLSVFGGRKGEQSELFFQGNRLLFGDKPYPPYELVFQGRDNHWTVLANQLGIQANLLFHEESIQFRLEYLGDTELGTKGEIRLVQEYIEGFFWLKNEKFSITKLAPVFFERFQGKVDSQIYFYGPWKNPQLEGYFELADAQIRLADSKETLRHLNMILYLDHSFFQRQPYRNYLRVSAEYGGGIGVLKSHFNLWNWNISEMDLSLDIPNRIHVDLKTPIAEYKGDLRAEIHLLVSEQEKKIGGTVFLGKGKLLYLGEQTQRRQSSWLDTWTLEPMRILVERPIRVNLGLAGLSLGELVLKEYSESTKQGTWISVSRTPLEDFQFDGVIESEQGSFDYLGRSFRIVKAKVQILPLGTQGRNPELELTARTKIRDIDNQVIQLTLQVKEDIYSLIRENTREAREGNSESILDRFSSIPSKSREEMAQYLGIQSENPEESESALGETVDTALNLTLIRPVEQIFRDALGIDTLSIQQNFLQNSFFQNSRVGRNNQSIEAPSGDSQRTNLFHNTEITIGKYLSQVFYLSGGVLLLQSQDPRRPTNLDDIWILGLEVDLLPLFRIESNKLRVHFLTEYQNRRHEIDPKDRHEGLFSLELGLQF